MAGGREKKEYRRQSKTVVLGILLVTFLFCGVLFCRTKTLQAKANRYGARETELQGQIEEAERKKAELEEREAYIQTEKYKYVKEIAKTKLGLVNPGETLVKPKKE